MREKETDSKRRGGVVQPSKWSRHRDSANSESSSNEEEEVETRPAGAQVAERDDKEERELKQDLFGIDKLLPVS